jgi:uncharacterized glyoxalase superfamily protein PhnB
MMKPTYLPEGHGAIAPFFIVSDAAAFIEFVKQAFAAEELSRMARPDGMIMHATIRIDGSIIMVGTREKVFENSTHLYVKDVDQTYRQCLSLGATSLSEPKTFPYGDRSCGIRDPFGNTWWIGTHLAK